MISDRLLFFDDYSEGAHPAVLDAIVAANVAQQLGYGADGHSALAARRIRVLLARDADIHLVAGGTQANIVCLSAMLRPFEGVVAPTTGHIAVHETGAIEATGHKVVTVTSPDGKLTPALVDAAMTTHRDEHTVMPRVVFLSQATEEGTMYSASELRAVIEHAHDRGLLVHLDGARLAMAVAAGGPSLADIARMGPDTMYIGGTKNGALCGEAIAVINPDLRSNFRYLIKQRGALMAKGRLLGAQFARLFADDGLWETLGRHANAAAVRLAAGLIGCGVELVQPPVVNQIFAVLPDSVIAAVSTDLGFHVWSPGAAGSSIVRLVCSWATSDDAVDRAIALIRTALRAANE